MPDETPDRVAATLTAIRADAQSLAQTNSPSWGTVPKIRRVIAGTERLLAAVEAALKLADDWESEGPRLDAQAYESCAQALREAITTTLAGTATPKEACRDE